ncbi:MAG: 23S rRNA (adenine(2503)-C(2))-methyltransferase RlmN [Treponema sp.]|nr:23S rRNA (adenine(2503)-C(2))-methyltransferase RlmN [Treponema sp.]
MKKSLAGIPLLELETLFSSLPRYRVKQIYKWIIRGVGSFDQMTDIPSSLQKELNEQYCVFSNAVSSCYEDPDGAKKIIITLKDGAKIEAVLLSDAKKRLTACISTQVGCPCACVFCKTGSMGFKRNLEHTEITEQFLHLNSSGIDNIVVMGMGEPLLNLAALKKAIEYLNDKSGLNISRRRITVSTCGINEGLFDIAQNLPFAKLALSLTTADEPLRQKLMPVTRTNPLNKVKEALLLFQRNGGGRVTLEVPLLGGINTREKDAKSIANFAKGLDTVVNIIPWNPVSGLLFEDTPIRECGKKEIIDYISLLESYNLKVTKRLHKGRKATAACGQLGT